MKSVAVLGAGSFGTALAIHLAQRGLVTTLWGRKAEAVIEMAAERENAVYLPGCKFPPSLNCEPDLAKAIGAGEHLLIAVPSHALRALLQDVVPHMQSGQGLILACKGLEPETGHLPHEVVAEVLVGNENPNRPLAVLSGPTFAREIGQGLPTAVTIASEDQAFATNVVEAFHYGGFRAYWTHDIVGVEIGGAVKNVIAIAVGMTDGLGLGANTRTALITRGLAEIMRLGEALGGQMETFMGLAGMGDLVLTCTDDQSRNRRMGLALASGKSVADAKADIRQVVEGVRVAPEVLRLAKRHEVDMPITEQVVRILAGECTPLEALRALATRPPRAENE
jgi:glycerol-3-phosphate dehydrogenase (NAD(P)+)